MRASSDSASIARPAASRRSDCTDRVRVGSSNLPDAVPRSASAPARPGTAPSVAAMRAEKLTSSGSATRPRSSAFSAWPVTSSRCTRSGAVASSAMRGVAPSSAASGATVERKPLGATVAVTRGVASAPVTSASARIASQPTTSGTSAP